jgi:hypothetical protein
VGGGGSTPRCPRFSHPPADAQFAFRAQGGSCMTAGENARGETTTRFYRRKKKMADGSVAPWGP